MADATLPDGWEDTARRIAREVAQRRFPGSQLARDLCDEVVGYIWERRKSFDPAKPFEPWCYRVVNNVATDLLRRWGRRLRVDGLTGAGANGQVQVLAEAEDPRWETEQARLEDHLDVKERFWPDDLKKLEKLRPLSRVIALAVRGWWRAIPPICWEGWLGEAGIEPPFPPSECCPENTVCKNVQLIAQMLGKSEDVVRQRYYRSKAVLDRVKRDLLNRVKYGRDQP